MKRRPVVIALVALGMIVLAMGWRRFGASWGEPRYQGRPLSYWTHQYVVTNTGGWPFASLTDEAALAVRTMGTNTFPTLLRWIRSPYSEGDLRLKVAAWLEQRQVPFYERVLTPRSYQPDSAGLAFQTLGTAAQEAIPALVGMLQEPRNAPWAARSLTVIGPPGVEALGTAMPGIADDTTRATVLAYLEYTIRPEQREMFVPILVKCQREDSSQTVQLWAAQLLGWCTNLPSAAVPLAEAIREGDQQSRMVAAQSLARFSPEALAAAAPVLEQLLTSTNLAVRNEVANLLPRLPRGQTNAVTR